VVEKIILKLLWAANLAGGILGSAYSARRIISGLHVWSWKNQQENLIDLGLFAFILGNTLIQRIGNNKHTR
jgi:hypothetical protein